MKHTTHTTTLIAATILQLTACSIKENFDDCLDIAQPQIHLRFECINLNYQFEEVAGEIELYFYTPDSTLAYNLTYTNEQLKNNDWKVTLSGIPENKYTLITHVNYNNPHTTVSGKQQKQTLRTEIEYNQNRTINYEITDTYYGIYELQLEYPETKQAETQPDNTHTIRLSKNTNTISLTIHFEEPSLYQTLQDTNIQIYGTNALYDWNNRQPVQQPVTYLAPGGIVWYNDKQQLDNIQKVMRIQTGSDLTLDISLTNADGPFRYQINIPAEIIKTEINGIRIHDTDEKLEQYDYFKFELTLGPRNVITELKINDWYDVGGGTDV